MYKLIPRSKILAKAKTRLPSKTFFSQLKKLASRAEDSGPDPDHIGSLLDGYLKIAGHPHGKVFHFNIGDALFFHLIEDHFQPFETRTRILRIVRKKTDGHQAFDFYTF